MARSVSQAFGDFRLDGSSAESALVRRIQNAGKLDCSLELRLPAGAETKLRLTWPETPRKPTAKGTGDDVVTG